MRILDIFTNPKNYFFRLKEKPFFVLPLIIIILFTLIQTFTATYFTKTSEIIQRMEERGVPKEEIERAKEFMKRPIRIIIPMISAPIFTIIFLLILSLILNLSLSLLGAEGNFKKTFAVIIGASLVGALGSLVRSLLILIKQSPFITTSLSLLIPFLKRSFIYDLFSRLDVFVIWQVFLIGLGLTLVYDLKSKKAYYFVFALWFVWVLLQVLTLPRPMLK